MRKLGVSIIVLEEDHEVVSHKLVEADNLPDDVAERVANRLAEVVEKVNNHFATDSQHDCGCDVAGCHARCNEARSEPG